MDKTYYVKLVFKKSLLNPSTEKNYSGVSAWNVTSDNTIILQVKNTSIVFAADVWFSIEVTEE